MILREIKNMYIKNRLTEGVDFKRYEWLKGDDTARIEWRANVWNNQLHTIIGKEKKIYIASELEQPNPSTNIFKIAYNTGDYLMVVFRSESNQWHIADILPFSSMPDVVDSKFYINNSVGYCVRNNELFTGHNMAVVWNDNVNFNVYGGKMQLLEEYDSLNDKLISSLVPCQLLKPIPASLDANNITRSAGECGMYDSVSGKFYGNVANSGTFTVEGEVEPETHSGLQQIYQNRLIEGIDYETYDWLRSTGGAEIGLSYTNSSNFNIELKGKELRCAGNTVTQILGSVFVWTSGRFTIAISKQSGRFMFANDSTVYPSAYEEFSLKITNAVNVEINENYYTISKKPLVLKSLFYWKPQWGQQTEGCVGHLKVDNYCNMYPCTLLHSIPRNLDAQCKARQVGECGMIDLVSGKFYGNVANSGTFTVENDNE